MTGAFVAVNLSNVDAHAEGEERAVRTAQLLADTTEKLGSATGPFLVLADDSGTNSTRVLNAGRITPNMGLSDEEWEIFAEGTNRIPRRDGKTGLRTAFHHCAGFIETPDETAGCYDDRPSVGGVGL